MKRSVRSAASVSELTEHAGFWLRFVSNHVSHGFSRRLLDYSVTVAEWVVMRELYGREAMPPSELAEKIGLTRGAVSKLVERLVEKELVARTAICIAMASCAWQLRRIETTRSSLLRSRRRSAKR